MKKRNLFILENIIIYMPKMTSNVHDKFSLIVKFT